MLVAAGNAQLKAKLQDKSRWRPTGTAMVYGHILMKKMLVCHPARPHRGDLARNLRIPQDSSTVFSKMLQLYTNRDAWIATLY